MTTRTSDEDVLVVQGLECRFGATWALQGVDLRVRGGEVVALLGENGAGKSTLIKILAGVHRPTAGTIRLGSVDFPHGLSAADARLQGLAFVHQDLGLLESLSVAENIAHVAGFSRSRGLISWRRQLARARELLSEWEIEIDPATPVERLEAAQRSLVAVARAVATDARMVVFDEPTAALPRHDVELLFGAVDRLRAAGVAVLYVTHRLGEVARLADRAVVLRDGRLVGTVRVAESSEAELVELIVGIAVEQHTVTAGERGGELLSLRAVSGDTAEGVTFTLHRGEILALIGLLGAGHRNAGRMVAGADRPTAGEMRLAGEPLAPRSARDAQRRGVGYVPADRRGVAGGSGKDTATNFALRDRSAISRASARKEQSAAARAFDDWSVVPRSPNATFTSLSGGNQQKVVLAKWMTPAPTVLVAEEPTSGIDVGTRTAIYDRLSTAARAGMSVLLLSSDADEVAAVADRAIVFADGRPKLELSRAELSPDRIARECYSA
ncbi:MAG: sugar ABC transporter ATP-binding protein [Gaiellaceae bacterium]